MNKKVFSLILALVVALSCCLTFAEPLKKHERVYTVLDSDGTVKSVTDNIRLENAEGLDEITDRTMLSDIVNVGGKETFTKDGETLVWQANGGSITYQGASDKAPAVIPETKLTLDGEEISAEELRNKTGDVVLSVNYKTKENFPLLAVSAMLLPDEGITNLEFQNAALLSEAGQKVLVCWAVPGADEKLNLPSSFTVKFHAENAELKWMMTFASSDPIDGICNEIENNIDFDAHLELDEAQALLTALKKGKALPKTTGKTKDIGPKINKLNSGINQLDKGAKELADGAEELSSGASVLKDGIEQVSGGADSLSSGAKNLSENLSKASNGATSLNDGLNEMVKNNEALNEGASQIENAILQAANERLKASGLDEFNIKFETLTSENYAEALDALLLKLDPESVKSKAYSKVEEAVKAQVKAKEKEILAGVTKAAQEKALEEALKAAKIELSAEQYKKAVENGAVTKEQAKQIDAAVSAQLNGKKIQEQIESAVIEQTAKLVKENTEEQLLKNEEIQAGLSEAQAAYDSVSALKTQLDDVHVFVEGLKAYTEGVQQAALGAGELNDGLSHLSSGAADLSAGADALSEGAANAFSGAETLSEGAGDLASGAKSLQATGTKMLKVGLFNAEKNAAKKLLPYVTEDFADAVRIFEETRDSVVNSGYDLHMDNTESETIYIMRTDF